MRKFTESPATMFQGMGAEKEFGEIADAGNLSLRRPPIVIIEVTSKTAAWYGRFMLNVTDSPTLKRGPYNSMDEAARAVLATGQYKLRPGTERDPHFDRI